MLSKNTFLNLTILFITIALISLSCEIFLRLNKKRFSEGYIPANNDRLVYELHPGYEIKSLNAKISEQGLNDRYFPPEKQPGTFRIAVVGDSTSFGWKVGAKKGFPKILETLLNKEHPGKFEVINFSVPGYNTSQEFEVIKEKVMLLQPDMVILCFCGNDTHICNFIKPKLTVTNYLYNKSFFVHFLLQRIDLIVNSDGRAPDIWTLLKKNVLGMFYYHQRIYPYPGLEETITSNKNLPNSQINTPQRYWSMLGYDNYKIHLQNIINLLAKNNITFVSSGPFHGKAIEINKELGVKNIYNFHEIFKGIPMNVFLLENDGHYSAEGHRLIAKHLYRLLNVHGLVPPYEPGDTYRVQIMPE